MNSMQAVRLQKLGYKITGQAAWHKDTPEVTYSPRAAFDPLPWVTEAGKRYCVQQLNTWN